MWIHIYKLYLLFMSTSAFLQTILAKRRPIPLMEVRANIIFCFPSTLVFSTRRMCWKSSFATSDYMTPIAVSISIYKYIYIDIARERKESRILTMARVSVSDLKVFHCTVRCGAVRALRMKVKKPPTIIEP